MDMCLLGLSKFLIRMHPSTLLKAALDESNKMCSFCNLIMPKFIYLKKFKESWEGSQLNIPVNFISLATSQDALIEQCTTVITI